MRSRGSATQDHRTHARRLRFTLTALCSAVLLLISVLAGQSSAAASTVSAASASKSSAHAAPHYTSKPAAKTSKPAATAKPMTLAERRAQVQSDTLLRYAHGWSAKQLAAQEQRHPITSQALSHAPVSHVLKPTKTETAAKVTAKATPKASSGVPDAPIDFVFYQDPTPGRTAWGMDFSWDGVGAAPAPSTSRSIALPTTPWWLRATSPA